MFITNHPAAFIGDCLLIADVHLGITRELYESGVSMPSQVNSFVKRLHHLKKITKTKNLVIIGDLKHKITNANWQEFREIPDFLERLRFDNIVLVKGNHDAGIEKILGHLKRKVKIVKAFKIKNCLLTHGHRKILKTQMKGIDTIIIGHTQPAIKFRDRMGASYVEPVWIDGMITPAGRKSKAGAIRLLIMPAFNELAGAGIINKNKSKMLGPIAKNLDSKNAHAFLLDGTDLGTIESLRLKE